MDKNIALSDESLVNVSAGAPIPFQKYLAERGKDPAQISSKEYWDLYETYEEEMKYERVNRS